MIKINLLPTVRDYKKRETIRQQIVVVAGVLLIEFVLVGVLNSRINGKIKDKNRQIQETKAEIQRLDKIIEEVRDIEKKRKVLEDKLEVIDQLEKGRVASVMLLDEFSKLIPEKLWITGLSEKQGKISLSGIAIDNQTVAEFISNLEESEIFEKVVFSSSTQITRKKYKLVSFSLACQANLPGR